MSILKNASSGDLWVTGRFRADCESESGGVWVSLSRRSVAPPQSHCEVRGSVAQISSANAVSLLMRLEDVQGISGVNIRFLAQLLQGARHAQRGMGGERHYDESL